MSDVQFIASNPNHSAWVSANAGAGKTKLLVDRVLRLLLNGTDVGTILCLTYTNAAAAEMRARIQSKLAKWYNAEEKELRLTLALLIHNDENASISDDMLIKARALLMSVIEHPQGLNIQTIHSLCQSILQRFPLEANVPAHFSVVDSTVAHSLMQEASYRVMHKVNETTHPDLANAITAMALKLGDGSIQSLLSKIISERRHYMQMLDRSGGVERFIDELYHLLEVNKETDEEGLFDKVFSYNSAYIRNLHDVVELLFSSNATDKKAAEKLFSWLSHGPNKEKFEDYKTIFLTSNGTAKKNTFSKKLRDKHVALYEVYLCELDRVISYVKAIKSINIAKDSANVALIAQSLMEEYNHIKRIRGVLDFDDLLIKTSELLHTNVMREWVLFKMDHSVHHLMLDEAQDTSIEQWKLLQLLLSEFTDGAHDYPRSLLVVGDFKQSIYSFQGATPRAFPLMRDYFSAKLMDHASPLQQVELETSFRSTKPVLDVVDATFAADSARRGVADDSNISHILHRVGQAGRVELWPVIAKEKAEDTDAWQIASEYMDINNAERILVNCIADYIADLINNNTILPTHSRPIRPSDVMILLRKRGRMARLLVSALQLRNIPVSGLDRMVLNKELPIRDLLAFARFLLLPTDDLNLAALLKSPFFNLTEEQLFVLCHGREDASLWQRMKDSDNEIVKHATHMLQQWLSKVDYISPHQMYNEWLDAYSMREKLVARNGIGVNDLLDVFLDQCVQYEAQEVPSLQRFVEWVQKGNSDIKRDMEQGSNMVRVLTVHAAKGLQAPIVILPDTISMPVVRESLLISHTDEGSYPLFSSGSKYDDSLCENERNTLKVAQEEEYRRLLYVAMTRAEEWLVVCGAEGRTKTSDACWYKLIEEGIAILDTKNEILDSGESIQCYSYPQNTAPDKIGHDVIPSAKENSPLPSWVSTLPAHTELEPVFRPSDTDKAQLPVLGKQMREAVTQMSAADYGTMIHRAIHWALGCGVMDGPEINTFLEHQYSKIDDTTRDIASNEIIRILHHPFYADKTDFSVHLEVPIIGKIPFEDGIIKKVSGQIDQLLVGEKDVWIVDYKSNAHVPEALTDIAQIYIRQMALYYAVVQKIYPKKLIHSALMWTANGRLMEIPIASLTETLRSLDLVA